MLVTAKWMLSLRANRNEFYGNHVNNREKYAMQSPRCSEEMERPWPMAWEKPNWTKIRNSLSIWCAHNTQLTEPCDKQYWMRPHVWVTGFWNCKWTKCNHVAAICTQNSTLRRKYLHIDRQCLLSLNSTAIFLTSNSWSTYLHVISCRCSYSNQFCQRNPILNLMEVKRSCSYVRPLDSEWAEDNEQRTVSLKINLFFCFAQTDRWTVRLRMLAYII